ncbi:MAG: V-type ATPase subunit [Candidatus Micrarchaeia archaeon]
MTLLGRALKYGYSNTRVKGMEAKLLDPATLQRISKASSMSEIMALLYETDYKQSLTEFGGLNAKAALIDFAINKNLAEHMETLVKITPKDEQSLMRILVARWDLYNVKLAIEAKSRGNAFESIATYLIDRGPFNSELIKQALEKKTIDELFDFLRQNSPKEYIEILQKAKGAYVSEKSALASANEIDKGMYKLLADASEKMMKRHHNAAKIAKMQIDMQNIITAIRAKLAGKAYSQMSQDIIDKGNITKQEFAKAYGERDLQSMLSALSLRLQGSAEELTKLEINLKRQMLNKSLRIVRNSVLSFATLAAYIYMKELEVISLRLAIKAKQYGIGEEELEQMLA